MKRSILLILLCLVLSGIINAQFQPNAIPDSGFVGINTTSPTFHLDVNGSVRIRSGNLYLRNNGAIYGLDNGDVNRILWLAGGDNSFAMATMGNGFIFYSNELAQILMRINEDGSVGIGTYNTGGHKLAVDGSIGARKVKVTQTSWADYVFEKEYKLPTLAEVEKFIQQHKHLPGIPSAEDVSKNGLDLGEANALLLKKIEELTLYAIEQQKQLAEQSAKLKKLSKEVDELRRKQ